MFRSKKAKAENLMATGAKAVGTLTSVQDTGMTVNDNPRVKMTFRIEPLDGTPAFEAKKTSTVSRVQIPQPGCRYPVWYDLADPSTFAFAFVTDDNGRAQIAAMFGDAFGPNGEHIGMPAMTVAAPAPAASGSDDAIEKLSKLADLHKAGVLTDEEFAAKKAELLGSV
jgi:Short C-terminal domain